MGPTVSRVLQGQKARGEQSAEVRDEDQSGHCRERARATQGQRGHDCWNGLQGPQLCPHTKIHSRVTDTAVRKTKTAKDKKDRKEVRAILAKGKVFLSWTETQS